MTRRIRFLILSLVLLSTAALSGTVFLAVNGIRHLGAREAREEHFVIGMLESSYQLKIASEQNATSFRTYLLSGSPGSLQALEQARRTFDRALRRLDQYRDSSNDDQTLRAIQATALADRSLLDTVIVLREEGRTAQALELFTHRVDPGVLNREIDTLVSAQKLELADLHGDTVQTIQRTDTELGLLALITLPGAMLLAWLVYRRVMGPLGDLEAASRAIARGDLHVRVPLRSDDELGKVALAFNTMGQSLETSIQALQAANQELRETDRYKDEFLSVISHELRTPLNFIMGFAGILDDGLAGDLTPQQHTYLRRILDGSERMLHLVKNLLDMSRIQAGAFRIACNEGPYAPLVAEALASLRPLADEKRVALDSEVDVPGDVVLDRERILQVLSNLVENAIKFTGPAGRVHVQAQVEGAEVVTRVSDTGIGIDPADIPKLFQRFKQLDMGSTREAGGTGLGLSICKALVEAHGGRIGVTSEKGKGSTFWYSLPYRSAACGPGAIAPA